MQQAIPWLIRAEGMKSYIYLDTAGFMTVGVGHMIGKPAAPSADAWKFEWRDTTTDKLQNEPKEIGKEFERLSRLNYGPAITAHSFAKAATLKLDETQIKRLLEADINDFLAQLRRKFPTFDSFPETAQLALLDMAFNLGTTKFLGTYPTLINAVLQEKPNWEVAAAQCHRRGPSEERNEHVRDWFLAAGGLPPGAHKAKKVTKKRSGHPPPHPKHLKAPVMDGLHGPLVLPLILG
jgi:GH24 family phage-related lysozyme (muramidase)